ncbi:MAG: hypothetical protein Q4D51_04485 [Eubacteriales bacterium]|nr:hypothetical protein [Eubacteriales bacterium]
MKDNRYKVKNISSDAVIACVLGGLSLISLITSVILSYHYAGNGPLVIGLLGIGSLAFSMTGFIFSLNAWKSVDGKLAMKRVAILVTMIPMVLSIIVFVAGLF